MIPPQHSSDHWTNRHQYGREMLAVLMIGYIVSTLLLFVGVGIGLTLLIVELVGMLVMDWPGVTTLNGRIHWQGLADWQRVVLVSAYLLFPYITLGIYLFPHAIEVVQGYLPANKQAEIERKRQIAQLEAQMGILPATEGTCRKCQKPLQVGAQYCAYCREPVVEHPRICPHCATTTLPDAQWCPSCGKSLDQTTNL